MAFARDGDSGLALVRKRADALHKKAWGKPWPHQRRGSISKSDIVSAGDANDDADYIYGSAGDLEIPYKFSYPCLEGMQAVAKTLHSSTVIEDILVVRDEYDLLRKTIEEGYLRNEPGVVVLGDPGIGKTTFLLYCILHRLERKLATAVQFSSTHYFIFDDQGAVAHPLDIADTRVEKCWALVDSNANVTQPCATFLVDAQRVIQASTLGSQRWRKWLKEKRGSYIISDPPKVLEIAAIAKELDFNLSSTLSLVRKWGPSTGVIIHIMESINDGSRPEVEATYEAEARFAAMKMCAHPSSICTLLREDQSGGLYFIRPHREFAPDGVKVISSRRGAPFIPTKYLSDIFESYLSNLSNNKCLELFGAFNSHSVTRTISGWGHESRMHARLSNGGAPLRIFRDGVEQDMFPSTHLLPGTVAGIKSAGALRSFYWIPSVTDFPGVDGVIGDTRHVYAVQAAIADDHSNPSDGLRNVWNRVSADMRRRRWHFVVVADTRPVAEALVKQFSEELDELTLDCTRILVSVWGCVLPKYGA